MGRKKWLSLNHWKYLLTDVGHRINYNFFVCKSVFFGDDRIQTRNKIDAVFQDLKENTQPHPIRFYDLAQKHCGSLNSGNPAYWNILGASIGSYLDIFDDQFEDLSASAGLMTIIAIQEFYSQNHRYPETVDELMQQDSTLDLPKDPFSGKWLVYRKTDDSFVLYSVGYDGNDEGGRLKDTYSYYRDDFVYWPVVTPPQSMDLLKNTSIYAEPNSDFDLVLSVDPNIIRAR